MTLVTRDSFFKKNYLFNNATAVEAEEKRAFRGLLNAELVLMNLRTYTDHSLVLHANDHLNNFVQLYIDGKFVVFLFNTANVIKNITIRYPEVLAPQRPPAPPTNYFQGNLGGYDAENLLNMKEDARALDGYIVCIRGLKIGDKLIDLPHHLNSSSKEEKGADFSGESVLQRKFPLEGPVNQIKVQLAFSSGDDRQRNAIILLIQTVHSRNYYLLVALSIEGELIFEEDRDGTVFGVRAKDRIFLNGARHSIYYKRTNDTAVLLIDREPVLMHPLSNSNSFSHDNSEGSNELHIGGHNTSDTRFASYKNYSGCLSNVFLDLNQYSMKPLDEYMLFTKTTEEVNVMNSQGIRSAQCSFFDVTHKPRPGPQLNNSIGKDQQAWVEDPPARIPYKSQYSDPSTEEEGTGRVLFIIALSVFCTVILSTLYHVYCNHLQYKKRRDRETEAAILWHNGQQVQFQDPVLGPSIKVVRSRSVCDATVHWTTGRSASFQDTVLLTRNAPPSAASASASSLVQLTRSKNSNGLENGSRNGIAIREDNAARPLLEKVIEVPVNGTIKEEDEEELQKDASRMAEEKEKNNNKDVAIEVIAEEEEETDAAAKEEEGGEREDADERLSDHDLNSSIDELSNSKESKDSSPERAWLARMKSVVPKVSNPFVMPDGSRTFSNPLSYLGGPSLGANSQSRLSKESILSID
ncbi:hypothetical protein LSTR_LSTR014199 [Laodelphax striatellus]|uniref:Laminin G domain-containing protein n=1 Tax=Laodelphax striatellus TaxID=195883 RepID=A0A482WF97_LAOST|nr:hypothetical protein LSTR_LSTR014199 [Laodelphax striatellus]